MNQRLHKIIFNQVRGAWMVVSEQVKAHGQQKSESSASIGTSHTHQTTPTHRLTAVMFALAAALIAPVAHAQIAVDTAATGARPVLGVAPNGVPVVQIATPNGAGVSKNLFTQYNVPGQGIILNNSAGGTNTNLGGTISGNNMIGAMPARTILNQITGPTATTIAGSQEVAGTRANLIIANPNGITVNGSKAIQHINTNTVTLTTGRPNINAAGQIDSITVNNGRINIETPLHAGLGALDILSRTASIAANVRADGRNLNIITGRNRISTDLSDITPLDNTGVTAPIYALDVKALGGMYAGQINLIATEKGAGVNNAGVIALSKSTNGIAASLSIDVNGNLTNTKGTISAGGNGNTTVLKKFGVTEVGNGNIDIRSSGNITNTSGTIQGRHVSVSADGDINVASLTKTAATGNMANSTATGIATQVTSLDGIGTIRAYGVDQTLSYTLATGEKLSYDVPALTLDSGKNINLKAAAISSTGGSAELYAGNSIVSSTIATLNKKRTVSHTLSKQDHGSLKPNSYTDKLYDTTTTQLTEIGSAIKAKGNLNVVATQALHATAATMTADKHVGLSASDITLDSGRAVDDYLRTSFEKYSHGYTRSGAITTTTKQTLDVTHGDSSQGTQIIGDTVGVYAKGITTRGSSLFGQKDVDLVASAGIVHLAAAADNYLETHKSKTKSFYDLDFSWRNGISFGTTSQIQTIKGDKHAYTGSNVTSLGGDINIQANRGNILVSKGTVDALSGDVNMSARNINIQDLNETAKKTITNKYKFTGLRLQVNSPILTAANMGRTIYDQSKDATGTTQVAALSVSGTLAAYNAYRNLTDMFNNVSLPNDPKAFSEVAGQLGSVSLSLGTQKQFNQTISQSSTSNGSQVTGGGEVNLTATGAGKAATLDTIANNTGSDIFIQGSTVAGTTKTILKADDDIQLIAGRSGAKVKTTESTADASITASAGLNGFSLSAAASGSKAYKSTEEMMNNEAIIGDKNSHTQLISGNDTNIIGSQVFGKKVYALIGRSLILRSLQDSYTFDANSKNYGVSLQAPIGGVGFGVTVNAGKSTMMSRYTSVIEQAGIYAGKDGFDINAKGETVLTSAKITSTSGDWAKNTLHTPSLTLNNLNNSAAYRANSVSASLGFNTDTSQGYYGITPSAPIAMAAKGDADSTTHNTINGNVGNAAGLAPIIKGTGALDRADDAQDTAALKQIFDEKKINTGFAIATTLGQNLSEFRSIKAKDIDAAGKQPALKADGTPVLGADGQPLTIAQAHQLNPNQVGYNQVAGESYDTYQTLQKRWGNGGVGTIILSAIAGAANGNVTGTGAQFAQNAVINVVRQYTATEIKKVADSLQNVDPVTGVRSNSVLSELVRGALHAMASCGGSVAVGGSCTTAAGAAAATVALNNLLVRKDVGTLTEAQKLAYSNLVQTLVVGAASAQASPVSAQLAAKFELENNQWNDDPVKSQRVRDEATRLLNAGDPDGLERLLKAARNTGDSPMSPQSEYDLIRLAENNLKEIKVFADWAKGNCSGLEVESCRAAYVQNRVDNGTSTALLAVPIGRLFQVTSRIIGNVYKATHLVPMGLGSTGRAVATNLNEQIALNSILSDPRKGKVIAESIGDLRWPNWSKMEIRKTLSNGEKIVIHYVAKFKDGIMIAVDDFKFK